MLFFFYWRQEEAMWPSGKRVGLAIRRFPVRSSPAPSTPWIRSRSSRVQILGHYCKLPASCHLPVGVFNPVTSYLNHLFLIIWVECLKTSWINNLLTFLNLQPYREQPPLGKYTYHHNQFPCIQVRTCIHIHLWLHYKLLRFGMDWDYNDALRRERICVR